MIDLWPYKKLWNMWPIVSCQQYINTILKDFTSYADIKIY